MKFVSMRSLYLSSSVLVAMSSAVYAQHDASTTVTPHEEHHVSKAPFHAALPEGQTLPQGMFNPKITTNMSLGNVRAYNSDSKLVENKNNVSSNKVKSALEVKYGVTDRVTAAVKAPFVLRNETLENDKVSSKNGTGFGDMEAGALYNFYRSSDLMLSAGLGGRFPTGRYATVKFGDENQIVGAGSYDVGAQFNVDFSPVYGLWLSVQDREFLQVAAVSRKLSDTASQKREIKGLSREGFAKANFGLGALSQTLKTLAVNGQYHYGYAAKSDLKTKTSIADTKVELNSMFIQQVGGGVVFDVRDHGIPASLELSYLVPFAGRDIPAGLQASQTLNVGVNAYL